MIPGDASPRTQVQRDFQGSDFPLETIVRSESNSESKIQTSTACSSATSQSGTLEFLHLRSEMSSLSTASKRNDRANDEAFSLSDTLIATSPLTQSSQSASVY